MRQRQARRFPRARHPQRSAAAGAALVAVLLLWAGSAAALELTVDPAVPTLEVGESGRLAIGLDGPDEVKLIELWMEFDPAIVRHLQGGADSLFAAAPGCTAVVDFSIPEPGIWHAYVVMPEAGCHAVGPGPLVYWTFLALAEGVSPLVCLEASAYDATGAPIPEVTVLPTEIQVSQPSHVLLSQTPAYQSRLVGQAGSVSVMLNDSLEVRSIELWVEYDPAVVAHDSAGPGQLFLDQPCYLWEDQELLAPGQWHGFAVIIGHECWIDTPGELFRWDFTAVGEGLTPVTAVDVDLYDRDGLPYEDVSLSTATVQVYPADAVVLRTEPETQTREIAERGVVSVWLDAPLDIRSVELWVEYDPTIIEHFSGGPGDLFRLLPCITWNEFEVVEPGTWHGFVVIIGHDCWTTGPGEVMRWEFTGLAEGISPITSINADLYAVNGLPIPNVVHSPGSVTITRPGAAVQGPATRPDRLRLHPNPFNPRTVVDVPPGAGETARLDVYDAQGRRVRELWRGALAPAALGIDWDGTDDRGRRVPSGVYIFRLRTASGSTAFARGTLVR